jgi:hypothetical protein
MFYVENVSGSERIWGGQIYADTQKRLVDASDLSAYQTDNNFLGCVLDATANVYTDENYLMPPQGAIAYISGEEHESTDGVPFVRVTTVPDDFIFKTKGLEFSTASDASLKQDWWPTEQGMECYLEFKKLNTSTGLLELCDANLAEYTILVWIPTCETIITEMSIRLAEKSSDVKVWTGWNLLDAEELGRVNSQISFAMTEFWSMKIDNPKKCPAPLRWYVAHTVGANVSIEVELRYFTNLVTL